MGDQIPTNQIIHGDCIEILNTFPDKSVDLIFADPPYNLQLQQDLWRPNMTKVDAVVDEWDQFSSFQEYDAFSRKWLTACRRVLKETGSIWVIGSYHNIYRIGAILQDLGFWILNDVVWIKTNPMPNFRGVRFTNAHETLLWASKSKSSRYTFNYHAMKAVNDDLQMRSDWELPICTGSERLKIDGIKAHSTQKPEGLLRRVILSSSNPGDIVLDPFFGSGTTGAVAKKLQRNWIGIELDQKYIEIAQKRLDSIIPDSKPEQIFDERDKKRRESRISFTSLLQKGLLNPDQTLFFQHDHTKAAQIKPDGNLSINGFEGSIHQIARLLSDGSPCNGWDLWYFEAKDGNLHPIDELRREFRNLEKLQ
jgi:site-specific DNA-methyltransferase (adenine-specific)